MAYKFRVDISDEEYKAFFLKVGDPEAWVEKTIREKVRRCLDWLAESASLEGMLDDEDKEYIGNLISAENSQLKSPKDFSMKIKKEIARRIKMKPRNK